MTKSFPIAPAGIPYITADQMREVDRAMIEEFGITLLQMMENAGRNLSEVLVRTILEGSPLGKKVVVAAGPGGNGGGALVAARHLHNRGSLVNVVLGARDISKVTVAVSHQIGILREMGVPVSTNSPDFATADAIVDGLFGYSLNGAPREPAASIIQSISKSGVPVISNDIPTGIDATTGEIYEPVIRATVTVTIALPNSAFNNDEARELCGDIYLGDIAVPVQLYKRSLGLSIPQIFADGPIVKLPASST
jgi:NAD(P)H-hydrate epimerase